MLLPLVRLAVTNAFTLLRLPPMSDRGNGMEIPALRHRITVLDRQPGNARPPFSPGDRAFLAALLQNVGTVNRRPLSPVRHSVTPRWIITIAGGTIRAGQEAIVRVSVTPPPGTPTF